MAGRCTICHHAQVEQINAALTRDGMRATARQFQVSRAALDRHKKHIPRGKVASTPDALVERMLGLIRTAARENPAKARCPYNSRSRHFGPSAQLNALILTAISSPSPHIGRVNSLIDKIKTPRDKEVHDILLTWLAELEVGRMDGGKGPSCIMEALDEG